MKKILLLALVGLSIILGYSFGWSFDSLRSLRSSTLRSLGLEEINQSDNQSGFKKTILRIGLVADSHSENEMLAKALRQAKEQNVDFVIGLGDYTNLGTAEELERAKAVFDKSGLEYYVIPGDRDGWASRQKEYGGGVGEAGNFEKIFGQGTQVLDKVGIQFVLLDNSDIYYGISQEDWEILKSITSGQGTTSATGSENFSEKARDTHDTPNSRGTLTFVFAHKTPFHPESKHVMGEGSEEVSRQARKLIELLEGEKVDGFFSGDLHFFAEFKSPGQSVKITTIGAVASERNFQGPRFGILKIFDDYTWEVEDVPIQ